MSYNKESKIIREFVRELIIEKLAGPEGMDVDLTGNYDTSFGPTPPTLMQSRGYQRAKAEGVIGTILNLLGMPQSALDLYGNFIGPSGFFDLDGIFGTKASPFGKDITAIGGGLLGMLGSVLGPRDAGAMGQGYFGNLKSALSGGLAIRREALEVPLPDQAPQIDESTVLRSLSEDIQKILSDFNSIVNSPDGVDAVYNWQQKTGFGENATQLIDTINGIEGSLGQDQVMNMIKDFISDELAPTYYSDIMEPILNGFLSPTAPLSQQGRSSVVSMIEDAIELIKQ